MELLMIKYIGSEKSNKLGCDLKTFAILENQCSANYLYYTLIIVFKHNILLYSVLCDQLETEWLRFNHLPII